MIINNVIQSVSGIYANSNNVKRVMKASEEIGTQKSDEIQLSSEAKSFSSIMSKLQAGQGQVRADKVAYDEKLVSSGNYNVSSMDLADKMLKTRF